MNFRFSDPRLRDLPLGSSEWFRAQRSLVLSKPLIKRCYDLWYSLLLSDADSVHVGARAAATVELGSGSSYVKSIRPSVITSDVTAGLVDLVLDGRALPFADESVRAIFLAHVFHHIPDVEAFFREALRVLVPGGVVSMIEISHTPFARFFFSHLHPEPYNDRTEQWQFPEGHSMLDSNQALSWVVLFRDRARFAGLFPAMCLERFEYLPWLSYLLSGGVNVRSFVPRLLVPAVAAADEVLKPLDPLFALHWHLTVRKAALKT
jgi:SAM-dependent methyltransferase